MKSPENKWRSQNGLTLIEVLIALVVLSIGLLSVATMQLRALQFSQSSFERSIAVMQANDLVERMWAGTCSLYVDGEIDTDVLAAITDSWRRDIAVTWAHYDEEDDLDWSAEVDVSDIGSSVFSVEIAWTEMQDETIENSFSYRAKVPDLGCDNA